MPDEYQAGVSRQRADATLRMYEGLLTTLALNVAYAHLLRDAAGFSPEGWEALDVENRAQALDRGRRLLLKAAKVSRRAYDAAPCNSKARSGVLLAGAAKLGIVTDWPGWEEVRTP